MHAATLRLAARPARRFLTTAAHPVASSSTPRSASIIPLSNVEAQWEKMSAEDQIAVHQQLETLQKKDWKELSLDEKKAGASRVSALARIRAPTVARPSLDLRVSLSEMGAVVFLFCRLLCPYALTSAS
jgi:cytochrome c oxidase subunit 4